MTWLSWPIAAIAAGIAIPALLILYFLKLRRRDLEVSTTLLWKKSIEDMQANAPFQKLRRNLLLFLQLLALCIAIAALGQPQIQANLTTGKKHVILIDRSASMAANDGNPARPEAGMTRLDAAKRAALELVDSLREPGIFSASDDGGDQAMVIAFDAQAEVRQNFTANKAQLRQAIEAITPTDAPTSIAEAFKLAKAYVPKPRVEENLGFVPVGEPAVIHIISDGRLPDAEKALPEPDDQVVYHKVGQAASPNLGVTGLRAERAFDEPSRVSIFVAVQNNTPRQRTADIELSIDGRSVAVREIELPPATPPAVQAGADGAATRHDPTDLDPATGGVVFTLTRPEGGIATARVIADEPDALPTDDIAYVVIPPAKRLSVALVTDGNLFLRTALEGMNLSALHVLSPQVFQEMVDGRQVRNLGLGDFDVVVLDRVLPNVPSPESSQGIPGLPPGRVLVLGAVPPPPFGLTNEGEGDAQLIVDWNRDHPALKHAGLNDLTIVRSRKVSIPAGAPLEAIAIDAQGPAIIEGINDRTRAIIVPWDPAQSDWPLKPGFVLFLAEAVQHLATDTAEGVGDMIRPGETLTQRLPVGAANVEIIDPSGWREDLVAGNDGRIAYGPVREVGIYTIEWNGPAGASDVLLDNRVRRAVASNLLDPDESRIGAKDSVPLASREVAGRDAGETEGTRKLWPYLLLAALGMVMIEWFVYNRKVYL